MSTARSSVLVVVVNYRTAELVVDCLRSLEPEVLAHAEAKVVVVDNASGDNSIAIISDAITSNGWSSWVSLIASSVNGGFAHGNNQAIAPALASSSPPDYFWLLNPDTVVGTGALGALTDFMADHANVGICGGGIDEADGTSWPFAFRFPSIVGEFERGFRFGPVSRLLARWSVLISMGDEPARVDWVSGATMMIRRATIETVGLMDDQYFLYYEETDYCLRARRAGVECWYLPASRVVHLAGQSTAVTRKSDTPLRVPAYWFESRRRYFAKNHGRFYAVVADMAWMSSFCMGRLRRWLQRKPDKSPPRILIDFFRESSLWRSKHARSAHAVRHRSQHREGASA